MINNQSKLFHAFDRNMLTSLSVDEMLLPRYVNWLTNFRSFKLKIAPSCLKHMNSAFFAFTYMLGQSMPYGFCLGLCICEKHLIICVVCVCHCFCVISSVFRLFLSETISLY